MKRFCKVPLRYKKLKRKSQSGMSAILIVIIIGASSIIMAKGAAFLSIGELDMSQVVNHGSNALYLSEACLEEALFQLKLDDSFVATNEELSLDDGSCIMNVTASGDERTINIIGIDGDYRKSIEAKAMILSGVVNLESYEVVDN